VAARAHRAVTSRRRSADIGRDSWSQRLEEIRNVED
jgi:hypothetical protein